MIEVKCIVLSVLVVIHRAIVCV